LAATVAGLAVTAGLVGLASTLLAAQGVYAAVTAPAVAMALAFVAGIVRSEWLERRERAELMSLFGRHVSREVAEDLWRKRDEFATHGAIKPQQIVATMFFLDIRSFTTVSEKLDPSRVVPWLNRGLTAVIGEITRHKGVVTRFAGDAVMAVFGAPVARATEAHFAEDAANAIDAALAIGPTLDALNARFDEEGLPRIRVRIGINTGPVTQCSVGAADRVEFTVLGDAVNTASRLESYSMEDTGESARVIIGEETFRLAGERYEARMVGSIQLKGKEVPVTLRQVLSKRKGGER
jgi:adenylate cyclase